MKHLKIILIVRNDIFSKFIYSSIVSEFPVSGIIIEKAPSRYSVFKSKVKRRGLITFLGQLLFKLYTSLFLSKRSVKRIDEIRREYHLEQREFDAVMCKYVNSVNSVEVMDYLKKMSPDLIIVNGTRIIRKEVINCTSTPFVNLHTGITPLYRGVHGGYWALVNNDQENFGSTVHLIDAGVDTGAILEQERIMPTKADNFCTYPYLQFGVGVPLINKVIRAFEREKIFDKKAAKGPSKQWYYPTLWGYIRNRVK